MLRKTPKSSKGRRDSVLCTWIVEPYFAQNLVAVVCVLAAVATLVAARFHYASTHTALELFRDCVIVGAAAGMRSALSRMVARD